MAEDGGKTNEGTGKSYASGRSRIPPVIDATAETSEVHAAPEAPPSASEDLHQDLPRQDLPQRNSPKDEAIKAAAEGAGSGASQSAHAEASHADTPYTDAAPATPPAEDRRSAFPASLLAASIVLGAIIAVAGAAGLHYFDGGPSSADLDQRFAALTSRVDALEHKPDPTSGLGARLAALDHKIDTTRGVTPDALAALDTRVSAVEATARSAAAASGEAQGAAAPAAGTPGPTPDLGPLNADIAGLATRLTSLEAVLAAPKADVRASQDRESGPSQQAARAPAVAIVAASLARSVERGAPFAEDLTILESLGVNKTKTTRLQSLAAQGVAPASRLADQFAALVGPMLARDEPGADAGLVERLEHRAARLVDIRRVDDTAGNDPAARVARVQAALARGDVEDALKQWEGLPAAAKAKSDAWAQAAKAHVDAVATARSIEADAVAALGKVKS